MCFFDAFHKFEDDIYSSPCLFISFMMFLVNFILDFAL